MLIAGSRVGPYEILGKLGEGGMGLVYRARDATLDRDVALKILPASVTADPDRIARFDREARTLASLNHPHIAQIYGTELLPDSSGGHHRALVMELVGGEDLSDRIARGPLVLEDALQIARQVADALAAAHDQRIVHRDLKPGNIRIRHDGTVKVLDFGLAKAVEENGTPYDAVGASHSPTVVSPAFTRAGVILGTGAYMSPEQARGRMVDHRTDIWAFGCVLFEMLSGRRPFAGTDVTELLAAVMKDGPAFDTLPPQVPPSIRRLLRRCLEKELARRLDSMRDARLELDDTNEPLGAAVLDTPRTHRRRAAWVAAVVLVAGPALLLAGYSLGDRSHPTPTPVVRAEVSLDPAEGLGPQSLFGRPNRQAFAVTADGRRIVFAGVTGTTTQLYVRPIDARTATPIAGTAGASTPFLSPDEQWIGFLADGVIRKVPLAGGPAVMIADIRSAVSASPLVQSADDFYGASWGEDGTIVFGRFQDGLWHVRAAGGAASRLTTSPRDGAHRQPRHLPGGRGILLTMDAESIRWSSSSVAVLPPGASTPRVLIERATDGRFVSPSHLVFEREGLLMAVPFDLEHLEVTGTPSALEPDILVAYGGGAPAANSGAAQFDVSPAGTLVFATGGSFPPLPSRLVWVDRSGRIEPIQTSPGAIVCPRLSSDGRRAVAAVYPASSAEPKGIYLVDLERHAMTPLTKNGEWGPLWSADGADVMFMSPKGMGRVRADGSRPPEDLRDGVAFPHSVTPDGKTLLFATTSAESGSDIWAMALAGDRTPRPVLHSPANEAWAEISPDGRWLAYGSDSSGRAEVYVQPFPAGGSRQQVSFGGGDSPLWSRDGRELFFLARSSEKGVTHLNAVDVRTGPVPSFGRPRALFAGRFLRTGGPTAYDVSRDGRRFLLVELLDPPRQPVTRLHMVLNWSEELRRAQNPSK